MTQKEVLESVLSEIKHIKTHMPNGELKQMQKDIEEMKEDISDLKFTMLNPENGVVVNTNKNTEFRKFHEANNSQYLKQMQDIEELKSWRAGVNKALWIIFGLIAAILFKFLFETQTV